MQKKKIKFNTNIKEKVTHALIDIHTHKNRHARRHQKKEEKKENQHKTNQKKGDYTNTQTAGKPAAEEE